MNPLKKFFQENKENAIDKWHHYFDIYDNWFKEYRNKPVVILEIGVFQGGSLKMWRDYFGREAYIYAIDINPSCKQFENHNTRIFIGSQSDRKFLNFLKSEIPKVDILIDDGGHTMNQQIVSFEELYSHVKEDGIYLCEDLHTSYWPEYGGGYRNKRSFIEYSKNFIDYLHAWHSKDSDLEVNNFTRTAYSLHYYDSILIVKKKPVSAPSSERIGKMPIPLKEFLGTRKRKKSLLNKLKSLLLRLKKRL